VSHSVLVNAIIPLAVEENGGEALTRLYELQRLVMGMYQNHEMKRGAKIWKIFAPLAIFVVEFIRAQIHCGATATSMKNPPDSGIVIPRTTTF